MTIESPTKLAEYIEKFNTADNPTDRVAMLAAMREEIRAYDALVTDSIPVYIKAMMKDSTKRLIESKSK